MLFGCNSPNHVTAALPSLPAPKLDQLIFCSETEAEGAVTITINAPEYIASASREFFVRRQRSVGEQSDPLYTQSHWKGGNVYPRESPDDNGFEKRMFESLECDLTVKIVGDQQFGSLKINAAFFRNRYKKTETISFPLHHGGSAKFGIVELTVSKLKLKNASN